MAKTEKKEEKQKEPYFVRHTPRGLGYEIIKREGWIGVYETPDSDQAKEALKYFLNGKGDKAPKPSENWPIKILKFEEKHGDRYFVIRKPEELYKIALATIIERKKIGWYYKPEKPNFEIALNDEQINALPNDTLKEAAIKQRRVLQREVDSYNEYAADYNLMIKAIKEKNGRLACAFMYTRQNCEYEKFEVITPSEL